MKTGPFLLGTAGRVATLALLPLLAGCGGSKPNWQEYSPPGGEFIILMPGDPTVNSEDVPTERGTIAVHSFKVLREKQNEAYVVVYMDNPPAALKTFGKNKLLNLAVRDMLVAGEAKEESRTEVSLDGTPGLEIKARDSLTKNVVLGKVFLSGNRLFQITAMVPDKADSVENASKFLDSFRMAK